MLSPMQFGGIDPVGSSRIGSLPNPRRNTSKEFFETFRSGNKADTCFRICFRLVSSCFQFVSALFPLVETERKHVLNFEASIFNESVGYGRQTISVEADSLRR